MKFPCSIQQRVDWGPILLEELLAGTVCRCGGFYAYHLMNGFGLDYINVFQNRKD